MPEENTPTDAGNQDPTPVAADTGKFTQEQVDRMVKDRLARQDKKWQGKVDQAVSGALESFRDEHGLSEEVLTKLGDGDKTKSEMRKLKGEATKARNESEEWKGKYEKLYSRYSDAVTRDAVLQEAQGKVVDGGLGDVWLNLKDNLRIDDGDYSAYTVDSKGEPSGKTVGDLVSDLLTKKPYLAKPLGGNGAGSRVANPGAAPAEGSSTSDTQHIAQTLRKGFGQ
jgi:hypothetical protein